MHPFDWTDTDPTPPVTEIESDLLFNITEAQRITGHDDVYRLASWIVANCRVSVGEPICESIRLYLAQGYRQVDHLIWTVDTRRKQVGPVARKPRTPYSTPGASASLTPKEKKMLDRIKRERI